METPIDVPSEAQTALTASFKGQHGVDKEEKLLKYL